MGESLLLLEDDSNLRKSLAKDFTEKGYIVFEASEIKEVSGVICNYAVIDLRLGGEHGLRALEIIKSQNPSCKVVVLTGYGSIATAVEAVKLGAINYLTKPVSSEVLEKALKDELKENANLPEIAELSKHEHEYIDFVMTINNGNISKTAKVLGLHRQSLQRKLKKYP